MSIPEREEPETFVASFDEARAPLIAFEWNGRHGDEFRDENAEFRRAVLEVVLAEPDRASVDLLRALFEAETRYAKEAWGVHRDIHVLGQALLVAGGEKVVFDFLRGKAQCFDTYLGCARVQLQGDLALRLAKRCRDEMSGESASDLRPLAEQGAEFFEALAARLESDS